jgi:hypothetical protein
VLEARDLHHAIQLMSQHPAVKYGSTFEIRPAADLNDMIRESERRRQVEVRSNPMTSPRAGASQNFESEEHTCQRFVSRDLVFRWTVLAQG